jgi:two-component system, cell cycle sensor histidine kinase and response regulator CckA
VDPACSRSAGRGDQVALRKTILLVDDEDVLRSLARRTLEKHGYTLLEACHAGEALRIAEEHAGLIDLVITDVVMPGMGGPELAARLAATRPDLRILYVSGYTRGEVLGSGEADASAAFLQKPFTLGGLTSKVREVLDSCAA